MRPSQRNDGHNGRKQLYSFVAGGLAGSFAATITCPLEVVKTKLQSSAVTSMALPSPATQGAFANPALSTAARGGGGVAGEYMLLKVARQIAVTEGTVGFFRGLLPTVLGIFPTRATYFWAYSTCKSRLMPVLGDNAGLHLVSAASAGIGSAMATNPIWMVKTRYQLAAGSADPYSSYADVISKIWREGGVRGFYRGLSASVWGVSETAIQFLIYERLKRAMLEHRRQSDPNAELGGSHVFLAAAGAKLNAALITYPHEVVRTRLRERVPEGGKPKYTGMLQSLRLIAAEEGLRGLYAGLEAHMMRTVPNAAFMFLAYETVVKFLERVEQSSKMVQKEPTQGLKGNLL